MLIKQKKESPADFSAAYNDINELGRRLRVIEERYANMQNKVQITEQNMVSKNKQLSAEIKTTNLDIHEIKNEINQLKNQFLMIMKEIQSTAKKEEVKVLERYLNLWEPIKFVTHDEIEDIIKRVIDNNQKF